MDNLTDCQLLRDYAEDRSEPAFAALVRRYIDFVYSAALRIVRDAHRAEDVTQAVFVALARNARPLTERPVLSGWLHRTAQNLAANTVRSDVRRRVREQEAAAMNELLSGEPDVTWEDISPHLDASLGELSEADRDALLLRYFQRKSAREMGHALGLSEEAAQKRVSRAIEHLRESLAKSGVTAGASGLVVVISANAVQAAPTGLVAMVLAAAAGVTTIPAAATHATVSTMNWINVKTVGAVVTSALVAGIGTYLLQQREVNQLRSENQGFIAQLELLTAERNAATGVLAALRSENERLSRNTAELLKLRNEITQLRQQPRASEETARSETNVLPNAEEPQVHIAAKFVFVPTDDLKVMGVVWTSSALGGRTSVLSAQKFEALDDVMREASDVDVISAPQVITFSGRHARLSVTKAVPLNGTNANVGASLDVIPYFLADASAFDLHVTAELSQLTGDASTPVVGIRQATNRTTLLRGQTLVLANDIPGAGWLPDLTNVTAGPRSLLVFVTPRVVDTRGLRESQ